MKNYRITVNGVAYDVAVEELGAGECDWYCMSCREYTAFCDARSIYGNSGCFAS